MIQQLKSTKMDTIGNKVEKKQHQMELREGRLSRTGQEELTSRYSDVGATGEHGIIRGKEGTVLTWLT